MNKQRTMAASVVIMTLSCAASALAQQHPEVPETGLFEIEKKRSHVKKAEILDKLSWAIISLINPNSRYRPVPLYGYPASSLEDEKLLGAILPYVAQRGIKVAKLTSAGKGRYDGQAVLFLGKKDRPWSDTDLIEAWKMIASTKSSGKGSMIAFSRPIRGHLFGGKETPPVVELVTSRDLWPTDVSPEANQSGIGEG